MADLHPVDSPSDLLTFLAGILESLPPRLDWPEQGGPTAWREAAVPAEAFPGELTTDHHRTFSLQREDTVWPGVEGSRTKRGTGGTVQTTVTVRWAFALRYDAAPQDYRERALKAEEELVHAVRLYHDERTAGVRLTPLDARINAGVSATPDGDYLAWGIGTFRIRADHGYVGRVP